MKVLKKRGAMLFLIAALVVTLTLGVVFMMPARTANAEEVEPQTVSDGAELQRLVHAAGSEKKVFKLDTDVELPVEWTDDGWDVGLYVERGQNITIDVNGHTLTNELADVGGILFYNMGTLSVIDSSEDHSGKAVSHGLVSNQKWTAGLMALTMNYGDLTLDVNFGLERPAPTAAGTLGYYTDVQNRAPSVLIHNEFILPNSVNDDVNHVSLTINGGTYDMNTDAGATSYGFFYIKDADLTINGGTFRNTSGSKPAYGGFLGKLESAEKKASVEEKIVEDRHVEVTINDCDMRGKFFDDEFFNVSQYKTSIPNEKYTVKIFGGMFPADFSAYTDVDHMMVEETITENEGQTVVDSYWVVVKADTTNVGAVITQNGVPVKYCQTFDDAWTAANLMTESKTIVLHRDAEVTHNLKINTKSKDTILDLNGYSLTIIPPGGAWGDTDKYHFYYTGSLNSGYVGKFIIQDNSDAKDGELVLYYHEDSKVGGFNLSASHQVILESGTIRASGEIPGPVESQAKYQPPVFRFPQVNNAWREDAVIINGGNIVSDFAPDDIKVAVWEQDSWGNKNTADLTAPTDAQKASFKIADPEFAENLDTYLEACGGMRFTWDLKNFVGQEISDTSSYKWAEIKEGYVLLKAAEVANYYAAGGTHETFADALVAVANAEDKTISALTDVTEADGITIPDGVTLNLSKYLNYTLTGNVTLAGGALLNGTIDGAVTVSGEAKISNAKLKQALTVTNTGSVSLYDGTYDGAITVNDGGKLTIYGGRFAEKTQLESYDKYIYPGFGATDISGGYRTVKPGVPSLAALEWYKKGVAKTSAFGYGVMAIDEVASTYTINSEAEWLYFSSIVNSGKDSFKEDTVVLSENLDFSGKVFLTAGIKGAPFAGTFNGVVDESGNGKTISNVVAQELAIGLFGVTGSGCVVNDITIANSHFTAGSGYFDEANRSLGYLAAGSVVGDGYLGTSSGLKITHDYIDQEGSGRSFLGAVIGHTYSSVSLKDPEITDSSVRLNWKSGGIVGYVEGGLTLDGGTISDLEFTGETGWYPGGVLAGDLNSGSATVTNATIDCPDLPLNGGSSRGVEVTVSGSETDIHVDSLGSAKKYTFNLEATQDEGGNVTESKVQVNQFTENDKNRTEINRDGETVPPEENPDGDGFIMEGAPKKVELFRDKGEGEAAIGELVGSYDTLAEALAQAQDGDRLYLKDNLTETVTVNKNVTINLYGKILTGTITVEGNLTLENGTVKGSVTVGGGTLTLATGETGLVIDNSVAATEAVTGDYTVNGDVCVRKTMAGEVVTKLELAASHGSTKYSADGNVITLSCEYCDKEFGTVTLNAPENATFGDEKIEATVVVAPEGLIEEVPAITYTNAAGERVEEITNAGKYTASIQLGGVTVSVSFEVKQKELVISNIRDTITYQGETELTLTVTDYDLTDLAGNPVELDGVTVTVTLQKSKYNVGAKQVVLISAINMTGNDNYALHTAGNEVFMELDVTPAALTVRVDKSGKVVYEGFAKGDDESVLEGELHLEWVDNGDGTSTVTPSGLTSANYVITFESGIVENEQSSNALWITLAVVGGVIVALGAVAVVYAVRRKKN